MVIFKKLAGVCTVVVLSSCTSVSSTVSDQHPRLQSKVPVASELAKAFGSPVRVRTVQLSPSGEYVAFFLRTGMGTSLMTQRLDGSDAQEVMSTDDQKFRFRWFQWVTDQRLIFGVSYPTVRIGGILGHETRLMAVNRDGSQVKADFPGVRPFRSALGPIIQQQDLVITVLHDNPPHVLIARALGISFYPSVYKLNVVTGEMALVQESRPPVTKWLADQQGMIRAGYGVNESGLLCIVKDPTTGMWRELDRTAQEPLGFDHDPNELIVADQLYGRRAIFRLNIATDRRTLIVADPKYDISDTQLVYNHALKRATGVLVATDARDALYWDDHMKALRNRLTVTLPGFNHVITSSVGRRHVVYSSSHHAPPRVYVVDEAQDQITLVLHLHHNSSHEHCLFPSKCICRRGTAYISRAI
jgi:hypothetical protein